MRFSLKLSATLLALSIPTLAPEPFVRAQAQATELSSISIFAKQQPSVAAEELLREAQQLVQSGIEHHQRSEFRTALNLWEEALSHFRLQKLQAAFPQESRRGEANSLDSLGLAYRSLGNYEQAIDFHQQALAIYRQISYHFGEANSLGNLGSVYDALGDYERAIDLQEQQLIIARAIGDLQGEANSLGNLGNAYYSLGEYERAIDLQQQQLAIAKELNDHLGEANSLGNLGNAYYSLGEYERAIDLHRQSFIIKREIGDRRGEAISLGNLGNAYTSLGDYERAIDFHRQSLVIDQEIGNRRGEASSLNNLGNAYDFLGDYERAIDLQQRSLIISREIGDRRGEAISLGNLGNAYYSSGNYEQAIDFHQQSLVIKRRIGNRSGEAISLGNLGNAYYILGDYESAIGFHQQALGIKREIGDRRGEAISLNSLGAAFWYTNDLHQATEHLAAAAIAFESLHSTGLTDANRLSLLDSQQVTYRSWQTVLMAQGKTQQALVISERGRAQALSVSMSRALGKADDDTWTPPIPPDIAQIKEIAVQQQATLVEYSVLPNGRIFIWVVQPDGTIHATESNAAALDDSLSNTANLFADLGQNGRGGPPPETPLSTLVENTQSALTTTRGDNTAASATPQLSRQQLDNNLQQLHALLIDPIKQWLPTAESERIIFIPHRELFRVPFAALQDSEDFSYLIEKHTILTAPSIQSLELASQHHSRIQTANATDALIVGNPTLPAALKQSYGWKPLPGAESEARKVGDMLSQYLGTDIPILTQDDATETTIKQRLHTARFIHLATHGTLTSGNADNPQSTEDLPPTALTYSTIPGVLALAANGETDDGSLTADELLEMTINNPLNAELVVLSACQTGQGPLTSDGVYGLSRTFLTAGVPTLVVSLWNASDTQTVGLMDEFYRQFLEEDQDKAQALRQAMLKMIDEGDDNPQHWAAFTLVGNAE